MFSPLSQIKLLQLAFNKRYSCIIIITARENRQQLIIDGGWCLGGRDIFSFLAVKVKKGKLMG